MQMAADLGVEWEDLTTEGGKRGKIRGLIDQLRREGRAYALVDYCAKKRTNVDWTGLG